MIHQFINNSEVKDWTTWQFDNKQVHAVPNNDIHPHVGSPMCFCNPFLTVGPSTGHVFIDHQSFDWREYSDPDNKGVVIH